MEVKGITFNEFSKKTKLPRTTVYTRINTIKENDINMYNQFVFENENQVLMIKKNKIQELEEILTIPKYNEILSSFKNNENKKTTNINEKNILLEQLKQAEKRYDELFLEYKQLVSDLKISNEKLFKLTENQQILMREQQQLLPNKKQEETIEKKEIEIEKKETDKKSFLERLFKK